MKLLWAAGLAGIGNVYGYSSYERNLKAALIAAGVEIVESLDDPFDIAVHIITPNKFRPIPGAKNLLSTMFEMTSLPDEWVTPLQGADIIVVPCKQNQNLFRQYYKGPVEICRLGIDPSVFTYKARRFPAEGEPFRFLWVGAPNPRKGYNTLRAVWPAWLRTEKMPKNVQLYMKTTGTTESAVVNFKMAYVQRNGKMLASFVDYRELPEGSPELPNVVIDSRDIPIEDLVELYHSAHAFILPSTGEGWGLTLTEAMATGLPCIWTHWGGPRDFSDEKIGFPLTQLSFVPVAMAEPHKKDNGDTEMIITHKSYSAVSGVTGTFDKNGEPWVNTDGKEIIRRCEQIYHGYDRALSMGKKASERMHGKYKWSDAAAEFIAICERYA